MDHPGLGGAPGPVSQLGAAPGTLIEQLVDASGIPIPTDGAGGFIGGGDSAASAWSADAAREAELYQIGSEAGQDEDGAPLTQAEQEELLALERWNAEQARQQRRILQLLRESREHSSRGSEQHTPPRGGMELRLTGAAPSEIGSGRGDTAYEDGRLPGTPALETLRRSLDDRLAAAAGPPRTAGAQGEAATGGAVAAMLPGAYAAHVFGADR